MLTEDDLKKLPVRAIVAIAVRCARRMQPNPENKDEAILLAAEKFCADAHEVRQPYEMAAIAVVEVCRIVGEAAPQSIGLTPDNANEFDSILAKQKGRLIPRRAEDRVLFLAHSAAKYATAAERASEEFRKMLTDSDPAEASSLATAVATGTTVAIRAAVAADEAVMAAVATSGPMSEMLEYAVRTDYRRALAMALGVFPDLGSPIDPAEYGPLGPFWPQIQTPPHRSVVHQIKYLDSDPMQGLSIAPEVTPALEIYIDPGSASKETLQAVLTAISDLHRAAGGSGLVFSTDGLYLMAQEEALV